MVHKNFKRCFTTEDGLVKVCVPVHVDLEAISGMDLRFSDYIRQCVEKKFGIEKFKVERIIGCCMNLNLVTVDLHVEHEEVNKLFKFGIFGISLN